MMASGTFGHGAEYASLFDLSKIGGVVTKTITNYARAGNPPPRTVETPSGMLNSIGLTNPGIDAFIAEKVPLLAELNTGRIVSIAGTSNEEFAEMAAKFNDLDNYVEALVGEKNWPTRRQRFSNRVRRSTPTRSGLWISRAIRRYIQTPYSVFIR